jgi:uncharacterized membrane protein
MTDNNSQLEIQRLSALSDGIFAVAMTLLAYNVHLPASSHASRQSQELARMFGEVGSLLLSFAIAAMFWLSHLRLFQLLQRVDFGFRLVNFAFLLSIVLLPISTSLSTLFVQSPEVLFVLGWHLVLISLMILSLWIYGLGRQLLVIPSFFSRRTLLELIPLLFSTSIFCVSLLVMIWKPSLGPRVWIFAFASPLVGHFARRWIRDGESNAKSSTGG